MGTTVKSMSSAMKGMQVDKIAKTMSEFERQFENMDVTSGILSWKFNQQWSNQRLSFACVVGASHARQKFSAYLTKHNDRENTYLLFLHTLCHLIEAYMESTIEATTSMTTPPEQVDALIQVYHLA